jgi:subtilase family serine protease
MLPKSFRLVRPSVYFLALSLFALLVAMPSPAQTQSAVAPVASRLTRAIDERQLVPLTGTVHRLATAANDRGAAADGMPLERMQVMLKRSDAQEATLKQTIQDMHTPGTATYHKWLTPDEFGKQFGPSDADIATLSAWLGSHGFTVTKVNAGRQTLEFSGTAGQFRETFHAPIHKYQVNGETHYANATDPQIPAAVAPVFGGFASLNNFRLTSHAKVLGKAQFDATTHKVTPAWTEGLSGVNFVLAPGDFAKQYDLTPLYTAGTNGAGQSIAIINESNISIALVNQYRSLFSLPVNPPAVIIDGNDPGIDGVNNPDGLNYASIEAYLDVELAGSVAPNATVDLVIAADTTLYTGLSLAAEHAVYGNVAPVLSLSFGGCEASQGAAGNAFWSGLWEQAAAQGQTVMVSSGDAGSAGCDNDNTQYYAVKGQAVNGLGSTPYNVSVGGTDFYYTSSGQLSTYWNTTASNSTPTVSLLQVIPEQPWNDSQYGQNLFNLYNSDGITSIAGGSGGASTCATGSGTTCAGYSKPAWQSGTGVPADGVRDLPDVSLFAANGFNYSFYPICAVDGDCQPATAGGEVQITGVGGTSASTPAFAGMMALVNQKYGPQGQADFVLYPLAKQFPAAFHDVTHGSNSMPCAITATSGGAPVDCIAVTSPITVTDPTYGSASEGQIGNTTSKAAEYNATTGYDLASGLGTIDANVMVTNWGSVTGFTPTTTTLTPSKTSFAHGTSITVSGTVTPGTSTGSVALMTDSTEPLQAGETIFTLASGAYSGAVNYLPGGTYNVYGVYSGNGTDAASTSTKTQITVSPESSTTTLTAQNELGNSAVAGGGSVSYGTQLLLTATPGPNSDGTPTGSVSFSDGSTKVDTTNLNVGGTAVYNAAPLVGSHSMTAAYSGDASYNASTSSALAFTVAKNTPTLNYVYTGTETTQLSAAPGTTTLTVTYENSANTGINNSGYPAFSPVVPPTGVVTVTGLGSTTLTFPALQGSADPNSGFVQGTATVGIPTGIAAATYTITINYPGDANYNSLSESGSMTITAASGITSTTSAIASPNTITAASGATVTTTVTGQSGHATPTGTVSLLAAGYQLAQTTLKAGVATATLNSYQNLIPGVNTITAQYSGDSTYAPSYGTVTITNGAIASFTLGNSGSITVAEGSSGSSTISVTPSGGFTGSVGLSCVVTPAAAVSTPTCSIGGSASITGVSPASTGLTVNTTSTTTPGTYVVTVTGTNGSNLTFTTSVPVTVTAVVATPGFTLSNSGGITATAGNGGTSTITVTPAGGFTGSVALSCAMTPATGASVPTCSVTSPVSITGTAAGATTLTVNTTATTTAGAYVVTVTGVNGAITKTTAVPLTVNAVAVPSVTLSNSGSITETVGATGNSSTITVASSGGFSGAVTLSCAVTPTTGTSVPTCALSATSVTTSGTSTLTVTSTSTTTPGAYTVTVSGTATGVTIAPTTVALTVNAVAATPTIALSGASITISSPGQPGTSTITVTPGGGFTGSVALSCAVIPTNETDTPTCSVTAPASITGTAAVTSTLTVNTTAASAELARPRMRLLPIGGGAVMAALLFFLVPVRRRRWTTLLGAVVLMAVIGLSAGCGSGGSSTSNSGTTTGTYTVTVTGTATGVATATTAVTVTVN